MSGSYGLTGQVANFERVDLDSEFLMEGGRMCGGIGKSEKVAEILSCMGMPKCNGPPSFARWDWRNKPIWCLWHSSCGDNGNKVLVGFRSPLFFCDEPKRRLLQGLRPG